MTHDLLLALFAAAVTMFLLVVGRRYQIPVLSSAADAATGAVA